MAVCLYPNLMKAQTTSPDQWEIFVSTDNAVLLTDTFRMQRFEGDMQDNWPYTGGEGCSIIEASETGFTETSGGKLMHLDLGSSLKFSDAVSPMHQTVRGGLSYVAKNAMTGEQLKAVLYEETKKDTAVVCKVLKEDFTSDLKHVKIGRTIYAIDFLVGDPSANTKNGYYCLDSVYLYGDIPVYSLFTGKTSWNNTVAWSHLPAERHRHALIKGEVSVTADTHCDNVSLNGGIRIEKNKVFRVNDLNLYEASSYITNEGELLLNGKIHLTRTFPEKGVWYFVSFPFDVYADGLDSGFTLKDETPNAGGNYFYVLTYNGKRRSEGQSVQSNWDVLPVSVTQSGEPVFEKNKGYLFAIDEQADATTISFSSRSEAIPSTFGKNAEINIDIPYTTTADDANSGWFFCGNPLPAPMHVNELAHPSLDGYVYLFNGEEYSPIPLDGNYLLPPYSAFFLKAKQSTTLSVGSKEDEGHNAVLLSAMYSLHDAKTEPSATITTGNEAIVKHTSYRMEATRFCITNAPEKGTVHICDANGRTILTSSFVEGETKQIALPEQPGFYVLLLQTQNGRIEYKLIR